MPKFPKKHGFEKKNGTNAPIYGMAHTPFEIADNYERKKGYYDGLQYIYSPKYVIDFGSNTYSSKRPLFLCRNSTNSSSTLKEKNMSTHA